MANIPLLDANQSVSTKEPVISYKPEERLWAFSLRYWKQIENFGLDKVQPKWFVSLLGKLQVLSEKHVEAFISNSTERSSWRYHPINWGQKNIPVQRKDLSWVDSRYLDNEEDYPLVQFQVSQALGRVIGFWDEKSIFNIVLLDPLHNIQPSKSHSYRVDSCSPLSCEYSQLLYQIDTLKNQNWCEKRCKYRAALDDINTSYISTNVVMHYISDEQKASVDQAIEIFGDECNYTDLLLYAADEFKKEFGDD